MKRYTIFDHPNARIGFEQREDKNGEWVKYSDVEQLQAERKEDLEKIFELDGSVDMLNREKEDLKAENKKTDDENNLLTICLRDERETTVNLKAELKETHMCNNVLSDYINNTLIIDSDLKAENKKLREALEGLMKGVQCAD